MLRSRWMYVVFGVVIGTATSIATILFTSNTAGRSVTVGGRQFNLADIWPEMAVHATATHGQDNFAIATGPIGIDVEAVYILDYLTGELKAAVLNLQTGKFMTFFEHNITKDFGASTGKNPRYLMVTGIADMRKGGQGQFGNSILYVAEFTSGQVLAYGLPWTQARAQAQEFFKTDFIFLDALKFRATAIRN